MSVKPSLILGFAPPDELIPHLEEHFQLVRSQDPIIPVETLIKLAADHAAQALMVSFFHKMSESLVAQIPASVKVVATVSVGHDHCDQKAMKARGLWLTHTPEVLNEATADNTLMHILGASRRLREHSQIALAGWGRTLGFSEKLGRDLSEKTLGIYGMGRIGQAVAQRARAFGMKIIYHNRHRLPPGLENGAEYFAHFEEMLPRCELLSLHAPASADTFRIMNQERFALLPRNAIFINVARGSLVDDSALADALESGHLFAAGLDVFSHEPLIEARLLKHPRVHLTPHTGSATFETRMNMGLRALENIIAVVNGQTPRDPVFDL